MQWAMAIKHLENALRFGRNNKEFNLAMGECKMQLGNYKEAIQYFGSVVLHRPTNVAGWEALIKCLIKAGNLTEANERCLAALHFTNQKPVLYFYYTAILFAQNKSKQALMQLENAMSVAPKFLKKLLDLNPNILQNAQVTDIVLRYKKVKKKF
jgi:tetratricopeptide (TPR) repeat protein